MKAAFEERATGDDRAIWGGVNALRGRNAAGVRMVSLENGELATTPMASRQSWQKYFAELLCDTVVSIQRALDQPDLPTKSVRMLLLRRAMSPPVTKSLQELAR